MSVRRRSAHLAAAFILLAVPLLGTPSRALGAAPTNDGFADAQVLSGALPIVASGTNIDATVEAGEPDHDGDPAFHSVWYAWTPEVTATVIIDVCEGSLTSRLGVYVGEAVGSLTEVGTGINPPPSCAGFDPVVLLEATAGTTYRMAVDGYVGDENTFQIRIRLPAPPANDDFANAQVLSGALPVSAAGTNVDATKEPGEGSHAGDAGGSSVWYSWTPAFSGDVVIDPCDSEFSTLLGVYTGDALGELVEVAFSYGFGSCSATFLEVVAGTTYRIAMDGVLQTAGVSQGSFTLQIRIPNSPPNDDFADAEIITGSPPIEVTGTNVEATKEPGEPDHAGFSGGASVWYSWTPAASDTVTLDTCDSVFDTILAVYTGSSLESLTEVASNDDHYVCNPQSVVTFDAVAGMTYHIAVDGFFNTISGGSGEIFLAFGVAPANDDFADAEPLSGPLPITAEGTTSLATEEPGEPNHAGRNGTTSVWYSWTAPETADVSIDTCGSELDNVLAVYVGTTLESLVEVVSSDDLVCFPGNVVNLSAVVGTTYHIAVEGFTGFLGSSFGPFILHIGPPVPTPENDDFADAIALGGSLPIAAIGTNEIGTKEPGEPNHAGNVGGASVWYTWTPSVSQQVAIDTCGSAVDTLLGVYTGDAVGSLTEVASNDDGGSGLCNLTSLVVIDAVAGTTYQIAIDGFAGGQGQIELRIRMPGAPANDDFADAQSLSGPQPISAAGTNVEATAESGEPAHAGLEGGRSVWYAWTASSGDAVRIDTCESDFDTVLAVYTGDVVGSLVEVVANDDHPGCPRGSAVTFDPVPGTTYRIAVDGGVTGPWGAELGQFTLTIGPSLAPANDDFADAMALDAALPLTVEGTTVEATTEAGEPHHLGDAGGLSVWYAWTPTHPTPVVIETCIADYNTLLAVYTGSAVDALDLVAGNDNDPSCGLGSRVTFDAAGGETYRIVVDGIDGNFGPTFGEFELGIRSACTRTIEGTVEAPLTVSDGITCLDDAVVTAPVRVLNGASLWSNGAEIDGAVTADGAAQVVLCETMITGPVTLTGGTSIVVGDPELGCTPNAIEGRLTVEDTNGPSVLAGNVIAGKLSCTGNQPAPIDRGLPNVVTGKATGQCASIASQPQGYLQLRERG